MGKTKSPVWFWGRSLLQFSGGQKSLADSDHAGARGAQGWVLVLAHLLSFPRTQDVGPKRPLSDDIIWVVVLMKSSSWLICQTSDRVWQLLQTPLQRMYTPIFLFVSSSSSFSFSPGTPSFTQHVGTYWVGWQGSWSGSLLGKPLSD